MSEHLPEILMSTPEQLPILAEREYQLLHQARKLLDGGFYDHAIIDIWNAAVHSLRRRVETYGTDIFQSAIKDEPGRKKYRIDGEDLSEKWAGVDDLVLISGATRLGLLNKKAGKSLEMINWMRNHASCAHDSDQKVELEDVVGLAIILQKNLFEIPLPEPGHSVSGLFNPVKETELDTDSLAVLSDQIQGLRISDIRINVTS